MTTHTGILSQDMIRQIFEDNQCYYMHYFLDPLLIIVKRVFENSFSLEYLNMFKDFIYYDLYCYT